MTDVNSLVRLGLQELEEYCEMSGDVNCDSEKLWELLLDRDFPQYIPEIGDFKRQYYQNLDLHLRWNFLVSLPEEEFGVLQAVPEGLPLVEYLTEKGYRLTAECCTEAASEGRLDVLKYLVSKGCPLSEDAFFAALNSGHFDCLKYYVTATGEGPYVSQVVRAIHRLEKERIVPRAVRQEMYDFLFKEGILDYRISAL